MKKAAYKRQLRRVRRGNGLYSLLLERLDNLPKSKSGVIRFPYVFERMCSGFHIRKQRSWDILMMLNEFGAIKIIPHQGIRILQ